MMVPDSTSSESEILDDEITGVEPKLENPLTVIDERITVIDSESDEETDNFEEEDF